MKNDSLNSFINQDYKKFSNFLFSLNPYEFTLIAIIIGFIISPTLTINEQNSLGNFFELLGQVILTINAQATTIKQNSTNTSTIREELEKTSLEEEVINLKKEIIKLRKEVINNDNFEQIENN